MVEYRLEGRTYDGVFGLNYPNISFSRAIPIFDKLKNQGAISEPVFAFYLSSGLPGEISITSDMHMTPPLWQKVKKN